MKRFTLNKAVLVCMPLLFSACFSVSHAQKRLVKQFVYAYCGEAKDRNNYLEDIDVAFYLDDKLYTGQENYYPTGTHTLRIVITPKTGYNEASGSLVIKKIEWQGDDKTASRKIIQTFSPVKKEFSFSVDVNPPGPYVGYAVVVQVDKCAGMATGEKTYTPNHISNEVRVVGLRPGVQVHKAGTPEDDWKELSMNQVLQEGDEISCDPDGIVLLQFADESTTKVSNTTQLKIASYFTEGGVVKTEILLKMGEVAAQVHKSEATKSDFRIKSPTDISGVRGTVYSHRYDPVTKTSTVKVQEGTVEVKPVNAALNPVTIKAGQQVQVSMNTISNITTMTGTIDMNMPEKKLEIVSTPGSLQGRWEITRGTEKGILTLYQSGTDLTGSMVWSNGLKGTIENGYVFPETIMFTVVYPNDLRDGCTAAFNEGRTKLSNGKGLSNKGVETNWFAEKK